MVFALTLSLLTATPDASVVVARRISLDAVKAQDLAEQLAAALKERPGSALGTLMPVADAMACLSKAGFPDTAVCNGAAACVASLAKVCGFKRLVALQVGKVGADVAVDVSIVDGATGATLAAVTSTLALKGSAEAMRPLALELLSKLEEVPAPVEVRTGVPPVSREEHATDAPSLTTHQKVAIGLGVGAVVSLGVGITLGVSALGQSNQLSVRHPGYAAQVVSVRQTALFSDVGYGAAIALAVSALVLWLVSPAP